MQLESKKYLYDVQSAAALIRQFTSGKSLSDFESDAMLRSAVERQFEIIGEALSQLAQSDLDTAAKISEYRRIISFRNILIHGYANVDYRLVWGVVEGKLSVLIDEVQVLLQTGDHAEP
jgi:uncharacterized protein with HEPN domain